MTPKELVHSERNYHENFHSNVTLYERQPGVLPDGPLVLVGHSVQAKDSWCAGSESEEGTVTGAGDLMSGQGNPP